MEYLQEAEGKIKEAISSGYEFKFEQYLSEGWDLTKKTLPYFLILFVIAIGLSFVIGIFIGGFAFLELANITSWTTGNFGLTTLIAFVIGLLFTPLNVGSYLIIYASDIRKDEGISNFIKGYEDFVQIAIYSVIVMIPGTLVSILKFSIGLSSFVSVIVGIVIGILTLFSLKLIAIKKYSFLNAIKTSVALTGPKFFHIILLFILIIAINFLGLLAIGLGLFVTIPFSVCIIYAYFKDVCLGDEADLELEDNLITD